MSYRLGEKKKRTRAGGGDLNNYLINRLSKEKKKSLPSRSVITVGTVRLLKRRPISRRIWGGKKRPPHKGVWERNGLLASRELKKEKLNSEL